MLVLTRKQEEEIVIGGNIRIKIVDITGNRVRIGISAPSDVRVARAEAVNSNETPQPETLLFEAFVSSEQPEEILAKAS